MVFLRKNALSLITMILCLLGLMLMGQEVRAGEKLVYAVSHKGTDYTVIKTEIFAIEPEMAKTQLLFSDENAAIVLLEKPYVFHFPVAAGGKLFAHAAERGKIMPFPGNASLYELSTDGTHRFRRICPVQGGESLGEIFVDATATRIGYLNRIKDKQYLFIHDIVTGALIHQIDITNIFLDCYASGIGWLPYSKQLFFSLETGCDDATSEASYALVGTYSMNEDGSQLNRLPPIPATEGSSPPLTARLIGALPSGDYIFETMRYPRPALNESRPYHFAVSKVKKDFSGTADASFQTSTGLYTGVILMYKLSLSGKYLAATRLPVPSTAVSSEIWIKDLETNTEKAILSIPVDPFQGPFLGLVGWL